ncbi:heavy metal tolerance protein, variant [Gaeumannomyces tritici R3-111a-1]|nr:heavy metal tolerance protein, variant [Gaeumannomyces tritici R3-111a-1]EJT81034.1 heavy metal tolerance protein, variant [Gaeumannomyces tritici R3-111a-1]
MVWCTSLITESTVLGSLLVRILQSSYAAADEPCMPGGYDIADLAIGALRLAVVLGIVILYIGLAGRRTFWAGEKKAHDAGLNGLDEMERQGRGQVDHGSDTSDETSPLLSRRHAGLNGYVNPATGGRDMRKNQNGSAGPNQSPVNGTGGNTHGEADAAFYRPNKLPHKTWWEYLRGYSLFFPYLWPRDSLRLQAVVVFCFIIAVLQRYVIMMVPIQTGYLVDDLDAAVSRIEPGSGHGMPWGSLGRLILFKILSGPSGLLGSVRAILWIPVSQYCFRALSSAAFEHVHSLSLDFHLSKRTGEVLSALNKGASINAFLEQVTFQVLPMLIDPLISIIVLAKKFNSVYAVCVSIMTFTYLFLTIRMAATRADQRRDMVNANREEEAVKNDSIVSYETVKYFNAEDFEFNRYRHTINTFQAAEASVTRGANNMNICQNLVFMAGMLLLLVVGAYDVALGNRTIGEFSTLLAILAQLQGPLNFFGTFYKTVQQAMISGERLLELFKVAPTVVDRRGVPDLPPCKGHIRWNKVRFWYDGPRPALRDLSFECRPGTTTAFVGESGGGKSTVFRLMFRYYNCHEGSIEVDGHNVKDVTIDSVRRAIGVVPQDTIMFNESIMYNLRYANQKATDEEVYEACRSASIHDRIMSFPEGYNTRVGERGLRLSGGEKQRMAIARLILKRPRIIMLDEATSALDSETEQQIQSKLIKGNNLGQNRTLLIIAHRLSTITHADQIIVLHAGSIIEKGSHAELLRLGGKYASMWEKQSKAEEAAVKARDATARANKLLRRAQIGVKTDVNDDSDGYNNSACSSTVLTGPKAASAASEDSSTSDDDLTNNDNNKTK